MTSSTNLRQEQLQEALSRVVDPEIRKPITELGMVKSAEIDAEGIAHIAVYLTTKACPLREEIAQRVRSAVLDIPGVKEVRVDLDVMNDEQRTALRKSLRGDTKDPVIPFAQPNSMTRVYAVASGKGGVGKSTVTVNLAVALAERGLSVGVLDADIYGHSVPGLLGSDERPTQIESMIMPPTSYNVRFISVAQFTKDNTPVVWRGPMLHRALQQFLADVYWGDLDVLLLDLPPGTGDVAISLAQLIPNAELLVITTPQHTAAVVAERAGAISVQTRQSIAGVIENMSGGIFGEGGGQHVADRLSTVVGGRVSLLGSIPLDAGLRVSADAGHPLVMSEPSNPAAVALRKVAGQLATKPRGLVGMSLSVEPTRR